MIYNFFSFLFGFLSVLKYAITFWYNFYVDSGIQLGKNDSEQ